MLYKLYYKIIFVFQLLYTGSNTNPYHFVFWQDARFNMMMLFDYAIFENEDLVHNSILIKWPEKLQHVLELNEDVSAVVSAFIFISPMFLLFLYFLWGWPNSGHLCYFPDPLYVQAERSGRDVCQKTGDIHTAAEVGNQSRRHPILPRAGQDEWGTVSLVLSDQLNR